MTRIRGVLTRRGRPRCSMGACASIMSRTPPPSSTSLTRSSASGPPSVRPSPTAACTRASAPATSSSRWLGGPTWRSWPPSTIRRPTALRSAARCAPGPRRAAAGWGGSSRCRTWRRSRRASAARPSRVTAFDPTGTTCAGSRSASSTRWPTRSCPSSSGGRPTASTTPPPGATTCGIAQLDIAGSPERVAAWLGEPSQHPLDEVDVAWLDEDDPAGPGLVAVTLLTPRGVVRID